MRIVSMFNLFFEIVIDYYILMVQEAASLFNWVSQRENHIKFSRSNNDVKVRDG
jgi:hypothetical protein